MTPDKRDCLNRINRDGESLWTQLTNREDGIPSGPAAELEESSLIESMMISNSDISKELFISLICN